MKIHLVSLIVLWTVLAGCRKEESHWTLEVSKVRRSYLHTQQQLHLDVSEAFDSLYTEVGFFKNTTIQVAFDRARNSWGEAYDRFLLLGPYRYGVLASPAFDAEKDRLDLFPVNGSYLDYTDAFPNGGIINDVSGYPAITMSTIQSWNLQGGPENLSSGFHVLEFFLWGESGQRARTDFTINTDEIRARRRDFLWQATINLQMSIDNLAYTETYENNVLQMNTSDFMISMIDGISEFIIQDFCLKTIKPSLDTQDPRLEISRFSDRSMQSIRAKFQALKYAFNAESLIDIDDSEHYFLENLVDEVDPDKMEKIRASFSKIQTALDGITVGYKTAITTPAYKTMLNTVVTELGLISTELQDFKQNFE